MDTPAAHSAIARVTSGKRAQRMVAILDLVADRGSIGLAELSDTLGISAATGEGLATLVGRVAELLREVKEREAENKASEAPA